MRLLCRILGHRRCRRTARLLAGHWRSRCRWCGTILVRVGPRRWIFARASGAAPPIDPAPYSF